MLMLSNIIETIEKTNDYRTATKMITFFSKEVIFSMLWFDQNQRQICLSIIRLAKRL